MTFAVIVGDDFVEHLEDGTVGFEQREGVRQHSALKLRVTRLTEWAAQAGSHTKGRAGERCSRVCLRIRTECNGGDTGSFKDVCERTHGTRAKRSNGCVSKTDVDALLLQPLGASRTGVHSNCAEVELVAERRPCGRPRPCR